MTQKPPPIPPGNRPPRPGAEPPIATDTAPKGRAADHSVNLDEQGRQGNIKQNTTHPGIKSDR